VKAAVEPGSPIACISPAILKAAAPKAKLKAPKSISVDKTVVKPAYISPDILQKAAATEPSPQPIEEHEPEPHYGFVLPNNSTYQTLVTFWRRLNPDSLALRVRVY
jgi:hypothetical protein